MQSLLQRLPYRFPVRRLQTPIVALLANDRDRKVLSGVSRQEQLDVHFTESRERARDLSIQLRAPLVLFDRDLPGAQWRTEVRELSASPHGAAVILLSGVFDHYLWQELIRWGGHDILAKPLQTDEVIRTIRLALMFRRAAAGKSSY